MAPPGQLRRLLPLLVLVLASVGSWTAAGATDHDEASAGPELYPLAPTDPVLSARRIPRALQAPLADAALQPRLAQLLEASPADTCLAVHFDGRQIAGHDPGEALVPASNQKLLTTWAALQVLGPESTFTTTAATNAPLVGGVLGGDLWLVGGGDPLLMTDPWLAQFDEADEMVRTRLEDLADRIVAAGVTQIAGTVVGDESRYDTARVVPTWAPRLIEQRQAGPLSALLVNEGIDGFPARYVNRGSYVPAPDPATHAAAQLATLLVQRGVTIGSDPRAGTAPAGATPVASVESPPLRDIIRGINTWSNNTGAELLVKAMDVARGGAGTTAGGTAVVAAAVAEAGLPVDGLVVRDGSGLDEGNRVSCALLRALLEQAGGDSALAASLPVAGQDGTLRSRFAGTAVDGRMRAKTGSLRGVSALSGYVESASQPGQLATFSYIANAAGPDGVVGFGTIEQQLPFADALVSFPAAPPLAALRPREPLPTG